MDVFLMIRRQKTTIFTDAKENTLVSDVKRIVEGILGVPTDQQQVYAENKEMTDSKTLADFGIVSTTATAQAPATIGLALRKEDGSFETLEIGDLSPVPELPDVMKPPSGGDAKTD